MESERNVDVSAEYKSQIELVGGLTKFFTVLPYRAWRKPTFTRADKWQPEYSDWLLIHTQDQARHIAKLEAENATLRAQLAGKMSISCADAANVLTFIKLAPPIVPSDAKPAMPSTATAHRKPQIGLRTL